NLPLEDLPSLDVLGRPQIVDAGTGTRNQVGDPEAPLGQPIVAPVIDWFRHEARIPEQLPEAIRVAGEVMAGLGGAHAGIDPDEKHAAARREPIAKAQRRPVSYPRRHDELALQRRTDALQLRRSGPRRQDVLDRREESARAEAPAIRR